MGGADHHPNVGANSAGEVGNGWCRYGAEQTDVRARRDKTRLQNRLQHVAGNTRVFANDNVWSAILLAKHFADRPTQTQTKLRRNFISANPTSYAIGAKVLLSHNSSETANFDQDDRFA